MRRVLKWENCTFAGLFAYTLFALYPALQVLPYHAHFYVLASTCALVRSMLLLLLLLVTL